MKFRYNITGLDCPNCAAKLADMMAKVEGINTAKINFLTEKLTVESELSESAFLPEIEKCAKAFSKDVKIEK